MATTFTPTIYKKMSIGDSRAVFGVLAASGSYTTGGTEVSVETLSDGYFTTTDAQNALIVQISPIEGTTLEWDSGTIKAYGGGGAPAHTHDVTVAAGTEAESIGFDGGGDIVSTSGGTFTTDASTASVGASTELNGVDLSNKVFNFVAYEIREIAG